MALISFHTMWLNPVTDLSAGAQFSLTALKRDPVTSVSTAQMADGSFQMVTTPGVQRSVSVTLGWISPAQLAQLETWQGSLLCYRDGSGLKFYGFYPSASSTPYRIDGFWSVDLSITEITVAETV